MRAKKLLAVLAHPDDESLGVGGTLAKYASEGVEVFVLTATRGDAGRYRGHRPGARSSRSAALAESARPGTRAAAAALGVTDVSLLDYHDGQLDRADPRQVIQDVAGHLGRIRPDVVVTFGPDGAYGHPDHIAISQFTTAAIVVAAEAGTPVAKFYYLAWPASTWAAYEAAVQKLVSAVDGVERQATSWPDWAITTVVDTRRFWPTVWHAVSCHESQISAYGQLKDLSLNTMRRCGDGSRSIACSAR